MRTATLLGLLVLSACFNIAAHAQPAVSRSESIESMVLNKDHVFIGKILQFDRVPGKQMPHFFNVTITVDETLKMPDPLMEPSDSRQVSFRVFEMILADWKDHSARLLVASDWENAEKTIAIDLTPDRLEALSADMKLLRDPEAVIQLAKRFDQQVSRPYKTVPQFRAYDAQEHRGWYKLGEVLRHRRTSLAWRSCESTIGNPGTRIHPLRRSIEAHGGCPSSEILQIGGEHCTSSRTTG